MNNIKISSLEKKYEYEAKRIIEDGLKGYFEDFDCTLNKDINDLYNYYKDTMVIARIDNEVVGTGALIKECRGIGRIVRVSVKKKYRSSGIGGIIINHLEEIALQQRYEKIVVETTKTWEGAKNFYYSNGYKVESIDHEDFNFYKIIRK